MLGEYLVLVEVHIKQFYWFSNSRQLCANVFDRMIQFVDNKENNTIENLLPQKMMLNTENINPPFR